MAEKDFGKVLNTVARQRCPDCGKTGDMLVHPEHRVYVVCGHSRPLPPIGMTGFYGKKRADRVAVTVRPTAVCNWCGRRIPFSTMTGDLEKHHVRAKHRGRQSSPLCEGSNKHRDLKPVSAKETTR